MKVSTGKNTIAGALSRLLLVALAGALIGPGAVTTAFGISIETVPVGDAGNVPDSTSYGTVDYEYRIGKYEVTNAQYVEFLNAVGSSVATRYGLYDDGSSYNEINISPYYDTHYGITKNGETYELKSADYADKPVNFVSFYTAARFTNWLTNGATTGADTENGLYVFSDATTLVSTPDHASVSGWAVASENEWYKAAYYKGGSTNAGYWLYPNQSDSISKSDANYDDYTGEASNIRKVGSYSLVTGAYGTLDQGGNLFEWLDAAWGDTEFVVRGGSFYNENARFLVSSGRGHGLPTIVGNDTGFRVVLLSVPEPGTVAGATGLAALVVGIWLRHIRLRPSRARRG
jgi:formylglycine-generating enzyme required for sulfatase activity